MANLLVKKEQTANTTNHDLLQKGQPQHSTHGTNTQLPPLAAEENWRHKAR